MSVSVSGSPTKSSKAGAGDSTSDKDDRDDGSGGIGGSGVKENEEKKEELKAIPVKRKPRKWTLAEKLRGGRMGGRRKRKKASTKTVLSRTKKVDTKDDNGDESNGDESSASSSSGTGAGIRHEKKTQKQTKSNDSSGGDSSSDDDNGGAEARRVPSFHPRDIPLAPIYRPTREQFADPYNYIRSIREDAQKYGICRIVPPSDWKPPFCLDWKRTKFVTKVQRIDQLQNRHDMKPKNGNKHDNLTESKRFANKLVPFLVEAKRPALPSPLRVGDTIYKDIDIFDLWTVVKQHDPDHMPTAEWLAIAKKLGLDHIPDGERRVKRIYEEWLIDYLRYIRREERDAAVEYEQRVARAKSDEKGARRRANKDKYLDQVCEECSGPDHADKLLLCDDCDLGYHTFCLSPPIIDIPDGEWYCRACVARRDNAFGFGTGNEYTLIEYKENADDFKDEYFRKHPEPALSSSSSSSGTNGITNSANATNANGANGISSDWVCQEFWRIVESAAHDKPVRVEYGSDVDTADVGSGFPSDGPYATSGWNTNNLATLDQSMLKYLDDKAIAGITIPWLYIGMLFSTFCWHNEDHYAYSTNYIHTGCNKEWYGVPASGAAMFERCMRDTYPHLFKQQPDVLSHLITLISPSTLIAYGVPVYRMVQQAGEFALTFPQAYHAGFNHGFNVGESVNFAGADWLPFGARCLSRYRFFRRTPVFSHDQLLCRLANEIVSLDSNISSWLLPSMERLRDSERRLRERLYRMGITHAQQWITNNNNSNDHNIMGHTNGGSAAAGGNDGADSTGTGAMMKKRSMKKSRQSKMGSANSNDVTAHDDNDAHDTSNNNEVTLCVICKHQLWVSCISCSCSSTKAACLSHSRELCNCTPSHKYVKYRYSLAQLDAMVCNIRRIAVVSSHHDANIRASRNVSSLSSLYESTPIAIRTLALPSLSSDINTSDSNTSANNNSNTSSNISNSNNSSSIDGGMISSLLSIMNESHRVLCSADNVVGRLVDLAEPDHHDSSPHFETFDLALTMPSSPSSPSPSVTSSSSILRASCASSLVARVSRSGGTWDDDELLQWYTDAANWVIDALQRIDSDRKLTPREVATMLYNAQRFTWGDATMDRVRAIVTRLQALQLSHNELMLHFSIVHSLIKRKKLSLDDAVSFLEQIYASRTAITDGSMASHVTHVINAVAECRRLEALIHRVSSSDQMAISLPSLHQIRGRIRMSCILVPSASSFIAFYDQVALHSKNKSLQRRWATMSAIMPVSVSPLLSLTKLPSLETSSSSSLAAPSLSSMSSQHDAAASSSSSSLSLSSLVISNSSNNGVIISNHKKRSHSPSIAITRDNDATVATVIAGITYMSGDAYDDDVTAIPSLSSSAIIASNVLCNNDDTNGISTKRIRIDA